MVIRDFRTTSKMTQITPDMNKKNITAIGIVFAYIAMVGINNSWHFLTGLEPNECVKRIAAWILLTFLFSYLTWIICLMFDIYDD